MSILKVAHLGHPLIRSEAKAVQKDQISSSEIQRLIQDMVETMHEYNGVGIAAPQVHVSLRVAVIEVRENPRYPEAPGIPLKVLINPEICDLSETQNEDWEGCLSIPDWRGLVSRAQKLRLKAWNEKGEEYEEIAEGFYARVIQHECDHLKGHVYLDQMEDLSSLCHIKEFQRYWIKN